jgi:hypothetical protein
MAEENMTQARKMMAEHWIRKEKRKGNPVNDPWVFLGQRAKSKFGNANYFASLSFRDGEDLRAICKESAQGQQSNAPNAREQHETSQPVAEGLSRPSVTVGDKGEPGIETVSTDSGY